MDSGDVGILNSIGLFEPLSPGEVERISGDVPVKVFERGRNVYTPAYRGGIFFLLLRGRVRVYRIEDGDEITLSIIRGGEVFGEAAFTSRRRKGSYAEALDTSRVGLMSRETLSRVIHDCPLVGMRAVELLSERLSAHEEMIAAVSLKKVPARLAALILDLGHSEGVPTTEGRKIETHYTHDELGAMVGAKRVAVTRALTDLQKSGAIDLRQRHIYVKDTEALERAT